MKLLVLGGTSFLGRHVVDAALAAGGHEITIFTRGQTNPDLFPDAERLRGDRDGGLDALANRTWDAVLDTSGYVPRVVRASAELLSSAVGQYTFVSSESVYSEMAGTTSIDEMAAVHAPPENGVEDVMEFYGGLKLGCERAVEAALPDRTLVVRPGLIVGPHDPTNRFTYWVRRIHDGGEILAPGDPKRVVQLIDARDLAAWLLRMIDEGHTGVYNADGPAERLSMAAMLEACCEAADADPDIVWVDEVFLLARNVEPWTELPVWIPEGDPDGLGLFDNRKAIGDGLTFRPLVDTARDTLAWSLKQDRDAGPRPPQGMWAGMERSKEADLLAAWYAR